MGLPSSINTSIIGLTIADTNGGNDRSAYQEHVSPPPASLHLLFFTIKSAASSLRVYLFTYDGARQLCSLRQTEVKSTGAPSGGQWTTEKSFYGWFVW